MIAVANFANSYSGVAMMHQTDVYMYKFYVFITSGAFSDQSPCGSFMSRRR